MNNKKLDQAIFYAENILEKAKEEDIAFKIHCLEQNQSEKSVGDSFMVFHLDELLKLLKSLKS